LVSGPGFYRGFFLPILKKDNEKRGKMPVFSFFKKQAPKLIEISFSKSGVFRRSYTKSSLFYQALLTSSFIV
jgi:hypothetical protein